ncbi:MAG TPA: GNAT family N-acetyltransferase [Actinomycetota bacterium]|nr:GNAT family N-acetyltransferase [Actinomycetota bacterium]
MATTAFPSHLVSDVVLRDGSTVRVRPARPTDVTRVEDYLIGLSPETRRLRFWSQAIDVRELARKIVDVDYVDHLTLLVLQGGDEGRMIGGAQYIRIEGGRAEVSFSVTDEFQGRGIGSILLGQMAQEAARHGVTTFVGEVLPENHRMVNVFRASGFTVSIRATPGMIEVEFPILLTDEAVEHFEKRETEAAVNAMRTFLSPRSVAVIGASRDSSTIGGQLFHNLLTTEFHGPVYPVNPKADVVHGVVAYPSVNDVPGDVDTAFIVVPAPYVAQVVRECGEKGVRALVVISSGFSEVGGDGPARQEELVEIGRAFGMRIIGPNCMGVVNTAPDVRLNGTFATVYPPTGRVGFLSQSGALGLAVMQYATELGLGLSSFVSIGNKADISGNDLVAYWNEDPNTDVVLLYLESFGNPRRFARLAREVSRRKPIIAVKSGRSAAGARAAASHTGALLASSDVTVDALFRQAGVIRTDTLEEMFDVATILAYQPPPKGDRVAIVTNAGGLGILCADTCEANGLTVPPLSEATTNALRSFLPAEASVGNPVDMIASATAEDYERAIGTVAADPEIDAMIVIYIPPQATKAAEIGHAIVRAINEVGGRIPVATTWMSTRGLPQELQEAGTRIPSFSYPEQAAIAMAHAARYGRWRDRPVGTIPRFHDTRPDEATGIVAEALGRDGGGWLTPEEVERLLACYGLRTARAERAASPEAAGDAAARIGSPVAIKAFGPDIVHKTEVGAVALGVEGPSGTTAAAREMANRVAAAGLTLEGFLVQEMIQDGVEMLVGVAHDPLFGPVVACSAGGTTVELVRDVAVRVTPITDLDASEMVRSLRTFPLLEGFRGSPKVDVSALEEVILRVGALVDNHPSVAEMDCNPVMVLPHGAMIVDARIRVQEAPPIKPLAARAAAG